MIFRKMGRIVVVSTAIFFGLIDIIFSIGCFGFYHHLFSFSFDTLYEKLLLWPNGFQFSTSPFDFLILAIVRFICLIINIIILFKFHVVKKLSMVFLGANICNISYSLAKILAFSELTDQLFFFGLWLNLVWNIIGQILLHIFWLLVLCPVFSTALPTPTIPYEQLNNDEHFRDSVCVNGNTLRDVEATDESDMPRISTFAHVIILLKYCGFLWKWFTAGFVFLVIYAVARIFIPLYTSKVIANILDTGKESFYESLIIMSVLAITSTFFGGIRGGCFTYSTALINQRMRNDLFSSITSQEISFFDTAQTGEILSRLSADCEAMSSLITTNVNIFLRNIIMVIGSFVLMVSISWRLTLVSFIAIPPIAFFTKVYGAYYDKLSEKTQKVIADANRVAEEVISTMRTVRSFASETKERNRFEKHTAITIDVSKKKSVAYIFFTWMNELSNNIILIVVLLYGGHLVLEKKMSIDGIIGFLLYQVQLGENFYNINYVFSGLMESVGASRKVFEYLHRNSKIPYDGKLKPKVYGKIEFSNVSFSYPTRKNTVALQDVSFVVQPGETVALVGPSGAGKSSIISLIEHFYEIDKGQIMLDDILIKNFDHVYYHQKVALVAQEPVLYTGSVLENILYGLDKGTVSNEKVIEAAKLANAHNFILETENGYETNCGEKGVQMSGGQKQRIAIARALVREPAILLLDEATSALDAESESIIKEAIQKCSVGRTVIIIAHRLSTVESADRIIVVDKGRIVQIGTHQSLLKETNGLYYSLAKKQLLGSQKTAI